MMKPVKHHPAPREQKRSHPFILEASDERISPENLKALNEINSICIFILDLFWYKKKMYTYVFNVWFFGFTVNRGDGLF